MNKPVKIPTFFAFLLIGLMILGISFLTRIIRTPTVADASTQPKNIRISNISDTGFTVTWLTDKPTRGAINVRSESSRPLPFFDDRTVTGNELFTTHSVTARGLTSQTLYTVEIIPQGRGSASESFAVTTFPAIQNGSNQLGPTYGTVIQTDKNPAEGALIYLTLPGSQTLSTIVKSSGSFLIPLNLIRVEDGNQFYSADQERIPITITVLSETATSTIKTTTEQDAPIPDITIGEDRDFTLELIKIQSTPSPILAGTSTFSSVLGESVASSSLQPILLTSPAKGARITSEYPVIAGTGIPNNFVTITLGSTNPQIATATIKPDGTWLFSPKQPVGIGNQSVTMTTLNEKKEPVVITHLFEILKSGTQVLGDATPSATPTFRATTPTPIPTVATTVIPTPSPTFLPTPTEEIPTTATTLPTISLMIAGVLIVLLGVVSLKI
jgi:hypothetical protein